MGFVYHLRPEKMLGEVLYPLNKLREQSVELYEKEKKKYLGREYLLKEQIPPLGCLWNDVIHCSPVNPKKIAEALLATGFKIKQSTFFKIPIGHLPDEIIYYKNSFGGKGATLPLSENDFLPINKNEFLELEDIPTETKKYFMEVFQLKKQRPLLFHHVPHVLIKGVLSVQDTETIEWLP